MKQNNLSSNLGEALERDIPGSINLWPAIRARAGSAKAWPRRMPRIAWAAALALIALLGAAGVTIALSIADKAAAVDAGINAVYKAGQVTTVNQTQIIDGVSVTLDWVYADPLRVLIAYSTSAGQREDFRAGTSMESLSIPGIEQPRSIGGGGYVETNTNMSDIAALLTPDLPQGVESLDGQLVLRVTDDTALLHITDVPPGVPDSQIVKVSPSKPLGDLSYEVHIPVTPGRIIPLNQQANAAGITVTLKRLIVAPTGVRADVCFDAPDAEGYEWEIVGEVLGGGQATDDGSTSTRVDGDGICRAALFWDALPLDAGAYMVRMTEIIGFPTEQPGAALMRIQGPWVFQISGNQ